MTRPSSSQREPSSDRPTLVDGTGEQVPLGEQLGSGGEGRVYLVKGRKGLAAKVYHKETLTDEQNRKLRTMVSMATNDLTTIAAWPRDLLFDPQSKTVRGILIPLVENAHELHELYGTTNRARHFPQAQWGHLVLAARNTAAAFHSMHERGIVVGDVNQGNLLVDQDMCVRFIDCDSFQIAHRDKIFRCPVGTPHFTPSELQSQQLIDVTRTPDHDRFGLAILIFHLLFVGRHPFAGRFHGKGDLTIERAIAERRFAFSADRATTLVDPPPASLALTDFPPVFEKFFEQAFRCEDGHRPTGEQWATALELLIKQRKPCEIDDSHVYYSNLMQCPWCRIEEVGGPSFFLVAAYPGGSSEARLTSLDAQVEKISQIVFPELTGRMLRLPTLPPLKQLEKRPSWERPDWLTAGMAASAGVCLAGPFWLPAMVIGLLGMLACGERLLRGDRGQERRRWLAEIDQKLDDSLLRAAQHAQQLEAAHQQRADEFATYEAVVHTGRHRYEADTEDLQTILAELRREQMELHLRNYMIRDYWRRVPGLDVGTVVVLESYGIETAYEVDKELLAGVPGLDAEVMLELHAWREHVEHGFVFKAEGGITERELHANRQEASRLFKISQARQLIAGSKRLKVMAHAGRTKLKADMAAFQRQTERWRETARERQTYQANRTWLERTLNQSFGMLIAAQVGVLAIALLLWLISRLSNS